MQKFLLLLVSAMFASRQPASHLPCLQLQSYPRRNTLLSHVSTLSAGAELTLTPHAHQSHIHAGLAAQIVDL
jgi:hypothetical protein